jgi:hypothetical protein
MSHVVNLAQGAFLKALDTGAISLQDDETEENILSLLNIEVPDASSNEAHSFSFPAGETLLKMRGFISKVCSLFISCFSY